MNLFAAFSLAIAIPLVFAIMVARSLLVAGAAMALIRSPVGRARQVVARAYRHGQLRSEALAGLQVLAFDALAAALMYSTGLLHTTAPTLAGVLLTAAGMFVWFEWWFFITHRAMHLPRWFWLHRQHHVAQVPSPLTAISFSIPERAILILGSLGAAVAVSQFIPLHYPGLMLYFLLNYLLNTLGHSNVELTPPALAHSWLGRHVLTTTTFHGLHHLRLRGHYGLFTLVLDRAFGSEFTDHPQLYAAAIAGQPIGRADLTG